MKEINDIIRDYDLATEQGKICALATVVHVEGSSYRRPGARMLVSIDGKLTGAISGGCLEGDAMKKAFAAIENNKNTLVTYNTTDEENESFGVQLGCNGIIHILFEPIDNQSATNPIALLKKALEKRNKSAIVTLFSLKDKENQLGTILTTDEDENTILANNQNSELISKVKSVADLAIKKTASSFEEFEIDGKSTNAFVQYLPPATVLVICGAGNDAQPLATISNLIGWNTSILDRRATHSNIERFPLAQNFYVAKLENALELIENDENTVWVLMTHNYPCDYVLMKQLIQTNTPYIGILGPKTKMQRMYEDLEKEGITVSAEQRKRIFSPMGLDIGAETSEEIAVSIVAEIKAVIMGKNAQMLREKELAIHV